VKRDTPFFFCTVHKGKEGLIATISSPVWGDSDALKGKPPKENKVSLEGCKLRAERELGKCKRVFGMKGDIPFCGSRERGAAGIGGGGKRGRGEARGQRRVGHGWSQCGIQGREKKEGGDAKENNTCSIDKRLSKGKREIKRKQKKRPVGRLGRRDLFWGISSEERMG